MISIAINTGVLQISARESVQEVVEIVATRFQRTHTDAEEVNLREDREPSRPSRQ